MTVCYVDTETTGLHPDLHEIWEVGLILPDGSERSWLLPVDLAMADPFALDIGRFHVRHPQGHSFDPVHVKKNTTLTPVDEFASAFAKLTHGLHMVGAVISFDDQRLARLLRSCGEIPAWHYHIIDVEALAVGYLSARYQLAREMPVELIDSGFRPPWKSDEITAALGIHVPEEDKHTALGDCRWAKAIYEKVMGG